MPVGELGASRPTGSGESPAAVPAALPADPDLAVTELYRAHWHRLVRLAWLLLRDQLAAEDVVQDAFVATHRSWSAIREGGRVVGYLQAAVVNGCRSVQRHQVVVDRQNVREAAAADVPGRGSHGSAEVEALRSADRALVVTALHDLPVRQREVVVLRYYAGLSEPQIAAALEISPGAVKTHAHRALTTLRRTIEPLELS
ncbi:SigE family RNA polymerase sigma factor [Terrabacter sp. NPDC080008]|uniref:RNA polymerase sigma factor n=1 Tax=Terrabacter sp. NPDC080008 TaxID=3155176 RepID=UPI00344ECFAB